ncbi:MAG TPA: pyridoxamine 5'-phosphate oxidase family protein, partial [Ilumatobacteraceae bacterium]|nr:pyridoxamine 5'-phosphate oxidase family protein [Ilumatobacteraceae bacterium]
YIQRREWTAIESAATPTVTTENGRLTQAQADWLRTADTFFIATTDTAGNADASHRGGAPGFVHVVDDHHLEFADYPGNNMFLTLDNISAEPTAGLLFIDWDGGTVLHLTGSVAIRSELDGRADGAALSIELTVEHVVERRHVTPLRWSVPAITG